MRGDQPGVSDATRASIKAIAEELGWRPNSAARALSGARAQAVGLVVRRPASTLGVEPFFMEFISGIESVLSDRSYALMLQMADSHEDELEVYRRWWGSAGWTACSSWTCTPTTRASPRWTRSACPPSPSVRRTARAP
ncbi:MULTISPECIES: hypothetical protein [Streptomyces]|uniref:hypothetical protein n=1 Tax=Streptomyces TaxID=1883 RepID=UPI001E62CDA5|nr:MULTISPECIES: hypothetical protein [Streptomyces]